MISNTTFLRDVSGVKVAPRKQSVEYGESGTDDIGIAHIYTSLSVAREEIWKRWNDRQLRSKVEMFFGKVPAKLLQAPHAALLRYVATPNFECSLAVETANLLDIPLAYFEFLNDKFCSRNECKVMLGKMIYYEKENKKRMISAEKKERLLDFQKYENVQLDELITFEGEKLVDIHHELFFAKHPDIEIFDVGDIRKNAKDSYEAYLNIFSFFTCFGVLFETFLFHSSDEERKFTVDIVMPSFELVEAMYGVKPLVVPLVSHFEEADSAQWNYYET